MTGPLAAAVFGFKAFEELPYDIVPAVRHLTVVDPFFGAVVFVGVLGADGWVDVVDFDDDPDYWSALEDEPD
jgi:hypothetical protein